MCGGTGKKMVLPGRNDDTHHPDKDRKASVDAAERERYRKLMIETYANSGPVKKLTALKKDQITLIFF